MIGWIILAAYVIGYCIAAVAIARFVATAMRVTSDDDLFDRAFPIIIGATFALLWPLVFPGILFYKRVYRKDNA